MIGARTRGAGLAELIERSDFWRRSPASVGGAAGHKEWSYFCVLADDIQAVVAFSIMDRMPATREHRGVEEARVTLLVRTADGWSGDVDVCEPASVAVQAGRVTARFGTSSLAFDAGTYRIRATVGATPVSASLTLRPSARPALTRSVPLGPNAPMQWFVVPRLEASGEVRMGQRLHTFHRGVAYHDHNWGRFSWGGNFAWEWGIALSTGESSWSLVYYRITDRGRHAVVSQGLLLWGGGRHIRTFRDGELDVRGTGLLRTAGCLRVPRVMRLAVPGSASDIPRRLEISARSGADVLDLVFALEECAQVCVPNDTDEGITTISECPARVSATGRVDGRDLRFTCSAVLEFNRAAA